MSQLCDQCIQELKDEANFMIHVLNTPHLTEDNIELANGILYGALLELYGECDYSEEQSEDGGWTVTTTGPSTSGTITVSDLAQVFKK